MIDQTKRPFKATVKGAGRFQTYAAPGGEERPYVLFELANIVDPGTGEALLDGDGEPMDPDTTMTIWINTDASREIAAEDDSVELDNVFDTTGQCAGAVNMMRIARMCGVNPPEGLDARVTTLKSGRIAKKAMTAVLDVMDETDAMLESGGHLMKADGFIGVGTLRVVAIDGVNTLRPNSFGAFVDAKATSRARRR